MADTGWGLTGGGVRTGEGGAEGTERGVWKPRGEAGLSGVWYPRDASESPRTRGTCSDCCVSSSSSGVRQQQTLTRKFWPN